jgi:transcriptional regulator with XRE-family HTH domain
MTPPSRETFAQRMLRFRKLRHMTQTALAGHARCGQGTISKLEAGEIVPGLYLAIRIATVLQFSLVGLVERP